MIAPANLLMTVSGGGKKKTNHPTYPFLGWKEMNLQADGDIPDGVQYSDHTEPGD